MYPDPPSEKKSDFEGLLVIIFIASNILMLIYYLLTGNSIHDNNDACRRECWADDCEIICE